LTPAPKDTIFYTAHVIPMKDNMPANFAHLPAAASTRACTCASTKKQHASEALTCPQLPPRVHAAAGFLCPLLCPPTAAAALL
jgi:hypothetical protein